MPWGEVMVRVGALGFVPGSTRPMIWAGMPNEAAVSMTSWASSGST